MCINLKLDCYFIVICLAENRPTDNEIKGGFICSARVYFSNLPCFVVFGGSAATIWICCKQIYAKTVFCVSAFQLFSALLYLICTFHLALCTLFCFSLLCTLPHFMLFDLLLSEP